jgi:putative ABC transport system permease protein
MLKNYFQTSLRYLKTNKSFTIINITGLATGICVCFFALLYVQFELGRDSYNKQADHIYRLVTDVKTPIGINYESTPPATAPLMQATFPEIKAAARVFMDDMIVRSSPNNAAKEEVAYADASVFAIFTWPLLRGDVKHLFDAPYNVVLSASAAKKYFGTANPIGQTLTINGNQRAAVTGVMQDIPFNAHLRVDLLFSMATLLGENPAPNWKFNGFYTYLLLQPGADAAKLSAKFPAFVNANMDQSQAKYSLGMETLKKVYLYGKPRGHRTGSSASGSITNIYIFSVIAVFVLVIACFNFVNLTTAFSLKRAKEVGVRKVLGASKKQLMLQFFMDAIVLCVIAFVASLILAAFSLPFFNSLAGTVICTGIFEQLNYTAWLFLLSIGVGLLSGVYPALFLSGFKPINTLKGGFNPGGNGLVLRKTLVIAQFVISIVLIISTIVVYNQLDFMQNEQLGFKKNHQLVIDYQFDQRINNSTGAVKQQLATTPGINSVSFSTCVPGMPNNQFATTIQNNENIPQTFRSDGYFVDADFFKQFGIQLIAGRGFTKQFTKTNQQAMVINEAMTKKLGFKEANDAIGKSFLQGSAAGTIVGVVKDFHFHSFLENIQPLTIRADHGYFTSITLNISANHVQQTIDNIKKQWAKLAPGLPFVYFFADEAYNQQYVTQQQFGSLFICFSTIAILISCLGLLGLSAFSTAQRKKEIGIRKILGASAIGITALLSREFTRLVIIALLIASPAAWWVMQSWLQGFAYHIQISFWTFVFSGAAALFIALLTVSYQAIKAAIVNPVKSLRNE